MILRKNNKVTDRKTVTDAPTLSKADIASISVSAFSTLGHSLKIVQKDPYEPFFEFTLSACRLRIQGC